MGRVVIAVIAVLVDVVWLVPDRVVGVGWWAAPLFAGAIALLLLWRRAVPGFVVATVLACLTGGGYALMLCASYRAGQQAGSRRDYLAVGLSAAAYLGVQLVGGPQMVPKVLVLVVLPMVVGRYFAQHRRLVEALDEHNRRLRAERDLLAERERLTERLRIARDMHDSLGHRLGLLSVQAAALEVGDSPDREAVRRLAGIARQATAELHELVGTLRSPVEVEPREPRLAEVGGLVDEFRAAGVRVDLHSEGEARQVEPEVEQAAYRVVEEGLTNAAKHAPAAEVQVSLRWEDDALLVSIRNGLPCAPESGGGHGLTGLAERVALAGGLVHHDRSETEFRLTAMLPAPAPAAVEPRSLGRVRVAALVLAVASMVVMVGPASAFGGAG
ncbi:sensor histidine kinase [Amycolatopsis lurida]